MVILLLTYNPLIQEQLKRIYEQTINVFIDILNNMDNLSLEWFLKEDKRLHLGIILVIISMIFYFLQDF